MLLSKLIKTMQYELKTKGDFHLVDMEDEKQPVKALKFDNDLQVYYITYDFDNAVIGCCERCGIDKKESEFYYDHWDHAYCEKCFEDDHELLMFSEAIYKLVQDRDGYYNLKKYIKFDGTELDFIKNAEQNINLYCKKYGYTYDVKELVKVYKDYYLRNAYIGHTAKECIENLKADINLLYEHGGYDE